MLPESSELCLATQTQCQDRLCSVTHTVTLQEGRQWSLTEREGTLKFTQLWVQIRVLPPTSCVIVEKLFMCLGFSVIICKIVDSNSYLHRFAVKVKKKIYGVSRIVLAPDQCSVNNSHYYNSISKRNAYIGSTIYTTDESFPLQKIN